ncbi:precorrin-2 C(20)-methyltransferase [Thermopetrobacter sp. TC1]|uniref:precorrin-2 C(20)-methyltransferase n=1 Tax=Thermopetrobacter sp. TC1 TaxID=1495045 RepID=UPI000570F386|nr:precorrin-2 C(20)-methyltransferase [Thermopetrobacter sp. TC1]
MSGILYGLGLGPGDPELITLKAWRILSLAPVVAWPVGSSGRSRAYEIARPFIPEEAITLPLAIPFGERGERLKAAYAAAAERICAHLAAGRDVAYLCLGDPLFHGSFVHLAQHVPETFEKRAVPGVMAVSAAAAVMGAPLALGAEILKILPATADEERLARELEQGPAALAFIKVGLHRSRIHRLLDQVGLLAKAWLIADIGLTSQRVLPLAEAADMDDPYFSIIVVTPHAPVSATPAHQARTGE